MPDALDRTLPTTRRVLGDVDPAQPLDTTHPLTDGLQGFWLPLPRLTGGSRLYDLSGRGRHGDLSDAVFDARVEGVGVSPGSSSTTVDFGVQPWLTGEQEKSQHLYVCIPDISERDFFVVSGSNGNRWRLMQGGYSKNNDQLTLDINGANYATSDILLSTGYHSIGVSHQGGSSIDSTLFIDGVAAESYDKSGRATADTASNPLRYDGTTPFVISHLGYGRTTSETEAAALHDQARRGFPDLLNRRDSVGLLGGGGTATTYTLSGTVTDSGGTDIEGATVSLENVTGAAQTTDTTDANGSYSISVTLKDSELPDTWDVVASASGYSEQLKQVSASTSSTNYTADFSLAPTTSGNNTLLRLGT